VIKPKPITAFLLLLIVFLSACDNAEFRKQIEAFQLAMSDSHTAVEAYYLEMNQFEKDLYLLRRELDAKQELSVIYANKPSETVPTIVKDALYINGPFSPKSIQARLDAIKLLGLYGNRLAELAGTAAPTVFENESAALGKNIVGLSKTFSDLAGSGRDATAGSFAAPIGKLVGIVGKLFLERRRDKELVSAIKEATPHVTELTTQLMKDFDEVINPQHSSGAKGNIALIVDLYNDERETPGSSRAGRKRLLSEINELVHQYELLTTENPQEMVQSMEDANQALLAFANSGQKEADFSRLVSRIGEFRDRAKTVVAATKEIRDIRRRLRDENGK
jgi:hypothetical protein